MNLVNFVVYVFWIFQTEIIILFMSAYNLKKCIP